MSVSASSNSILLTAITIAIQLRGKLYLNHSPVWVHGEELGLIYHPITIPDCASLTWVTLAGSTAFIPFNTTA
ncbi:uncharacterized protein EV420DRAFT_392621 [Desarmillaria tabescens]|uniref:Uncharacterized protein n=1 Tax=Armillaria tabescens TaxID=1929756 RepID=A0AA39KEH4_ARMTA|nr:uncharacterized protein EV420DRAFT_392621 [Desarmillaria tabescens]KAK0458319.1 hypothetical protein EV420DRAFT_392621 [Desarmillaria tabescens]